MVPFAQGQAYIRNSSEYEAAARPLRSAPSEEFIFSQARLSDILRMLAAEAGINFISLPADQNGCITPGDLYVHDESVPSSGDADSGQWDCLGLQQSEQPLVIEAVE